MILVLAVAALIFFGALLVPAKKTPSTGSRRLVIYTDGETGCQYIRIRGFEGVTVRIGKDGKPLCRPELREKVTE